MAILTPTALAARIDADLADNTSGEITPELVRQLFNDMVESQNNWHGWGEYVDSTYTSGSPFSISGNTDTQIPCDAVAANLGREPSDVTLFSAGKIQGKNLELRLITLNMKVKPTNVGTTLVETWYDIGGAVGELYRRPITFPKGNGVERQIVQTTLVYTADTWEANGATPYMRANGSFEVYDVRFIIRRMSIDFDGITF